MMPRLLALLLLVSCTWRRDPGPAALDRAKGPVLTVVQDVATPVVTLQISARTGSAHDPAGREGVAALTARLMRQGGAGDHSPEEVERLLYRMGTDVEVIVDQEQVSFTARCLPEEAPVLAGLMADMLMAPRLDPDVFARLRDEAADQLHSGLLDDDEALGLEALNRWIYEGHPYGHPADGRWGALPTLSLQDVRSFIAERYVRPVVVIGVSGPVGGGAVSPARVALDTLSARLEALPARLYRDVTPRLAPTVKGRSLLIVQKPTQSVGFHLGHPTELNRSHPDWPAMSLVLSALGEHRKSHGRLFQLIRAERGLNYGDYAYGEIYRQAGYGSNQQPGTGRVQNPFYVWLRPLEPVNAPFALKAALRALDQLVATGLDPDEFKAKQASFAARVPLWAADPSSRLGFAVEAALMGWPDPVLTLPDAVAKLELAQVNAAIARNLHPENLDIVAVAQDAGALRHALLEEKATPLVYRGTPPADDTPMKQEDERIAGYAAGVGTVHVAPAEELFR